jgi:hypothetical protein
LYICVVKLVRRHGKFVVAFLSEAVILILELLRATVSCFGSFIPLRAAHVAVLL